MIYKHISAIAMALVCAGCEESSLPRAVTTPAVHSPAAAPSKVFRAVGDALEADTSDILVRALPGSIDVTLRTGRDGDTPLRLTTRSLVRGAVVLPRASDVQLASDGHARWHTPSVTEHLRLHADALEQVWEVPEAPAGSGPLRVEVAVTGARWLAEDERGQYFAYGGRSFRYSHGAWIDANGTRTQIPAAWDGTSIVLQVPETVLADTVWPALLDPTLSLETPLGDTIAIPFLYDVYRPTSAFNGTHHLVVHQFGWSDYTVTNSIGTRMTTEGEALDVGGIAIGAVERRYESSPRVASDGASWLVIWSEPSPPSFRAYGRIVGADGVPATNTLDLLPLGFRGTTQVYHDGASYLLFEPDMGFARVANDGTLLDSSMRSFGFDTSMRDTQIACSSSTCLVPYTGPSRTSIRAVRTSPGMVAIDTEPIVISSGTTTRTMGDAIWDGSQWVLIWTERPASGPLEIRVARVRPDGSVGDPNGVLVGTVGTLQQSPSIASYGAGYVVGWNERLATSMYMYRARTISLDLHTQGPVVDIGLVVSNERPHMTSDPTGAWLIYGRYLGAGHYEVQATHVSPDGVFEPARAVAIGTNDQDDVALATDGVDFMAVWADRRSRGDWDVYAQPLSGTDGAPLTSAVRVTSRSGNQTKPSIAYDGTVYVVSWLDDSDGENDIFAARLARGGAVLDPEAFPVANTNDAQLEQVAASNGRGTTIIVWRDGRSSTNPYHARVASDGTVENPNGTAVPVGLAMNPRIASNGTTFLIACGDAGVGSIRAAVISASGATLRGSIDTRLGVNVYTNNPLDVGTDGSNYLLVGVRDAAMRIGGDGRLIDSPPLYTLFAGLSSDPSIAYDGFNYVVVGSGRGFDDLAAWRATSEAALLDPAPFEVAPPSRQIHSCDVASLRDGRTLVAYVSRAFAAPYGARRVFTRFLAYAVNGTSCTSAPDCASGFCVDGVCCNTACAAGTVSDCVACSRAAGATTDGVCGPVASGVLCRAEAGPCDVQETCDGVSAACPTDAFLPAGIPCRVSTSPCDVAETCSGSTALCPVDEAAPDGTSCADEVYCNGAEVCIAGSCSSVPGVSCDDGDVCSNDRCVEGSGCVSDPISDCCRTSSECDDSDSCTNDECVDRSCVFTPNGACSTADAGTSDSGVAMPDGGTPADGGGRDAGNVDSGTGSADASFARDAATRDADTGSDAGRPMSRGGCGCRAAGQAPYRGFGALGGLTGAIIILGARRRIRMRAGARNAGSSSVMQER